TQVVLNGLDPNEGVYYFKVAAVNEGGESLAHDVVAATPYEADQRVLIIDGFDRNDRTMNPLQAVGSSTTERVRPALSNSQDYAVAHAEAIEAWAPRGLAVATAMNEAAIAGDVDLSDYDAVVWILGEESTADDTFDATEQALVTAYLNAGGKLFVSGAEIGWDLDNLNNGRTFYNQTLRADYAADDANTYDAAGVNGSIFEGISLTFDDGTYVYDATFPDVINPANGSTLAMNYGASGTGGGAAVQFNEQLVMLGFPFETILGERDRYDVMGAALDYFGLDAGLTRLDRIVDAGDPGYADTGSWANQSGGYNGSTQRVLTGANPTDAATWDQLIPLAGQYELLIHHGATANPASSVPYTIETASGPELITVNQRVDAGQWRSLGVYELAAGLNTVTLSAGSATGGTTVSADAVRWVAAFDDLTPGDAELDGDVDFADAMQLLSSLRGGVSDATWNDGDFNFDGTVDQQDVTLLQANYTGLSNPPTDPTPPSSALSARPADAGVLTDGERIPPPNNNASNSGFASGLAFAELEDDALVTPFTASVSRQPAQQAQTQTNQQQRQQQQTQRTQRTAAASAPATTQQPLLQSQGQQQQNQRQRTQNVQTSSRRVAYTAPTRGISASSYAAKTVTQAANPTVNARPGTISLLVGNDAPMKTIEQDADANFKSA
ncbi:MAG: hypothetical protein AAGH92_04580, partial [Planctomycetota bacterium]